MGEISGMLMEFKYHKFPEKKKKFEIDAEEAIVSSKMVLYAYKSRGKIKIIEE